MKFTLDETVSVTAGADGVARADLGPRHLAHSWRVDLATVSSDSALRTLAFLGTDGGSNLGGTSSGNQDSNDLPGVILGCGQVMSAKWHNATPGARCTLSVYGTVEVKGR